MNINVTFVFQVLNFLFSYWFLNRFLFIPVIRHIEERKSGDRHLFSLIEKKEKYLLKLEEEKYQRLIKFKETINKGFQLKRRKIANIPECYHFKLDDKSVEKSISKMSKILVKKVPHVD